MIIRYIVATYQPAEVIKFIDYANELRADPEIISRVDVGWVIIHLRNKSCCYKTWNIKEGTTADVFAYQDKKTGEWFISTHPDILLTNNLDELPRKQ